MLTFVPSSVLRPCLMYDISSLVISTDCFTNPIVMDQHNPGDEGFDFCQMLV